MLQDVTYAECWPAQSLDLVNLSRGFGIRGLCVYSRPKMRVYLGGQPVLQRTCEPLGSFWQMSAHQYMSVGTVTAPRLQANLPTWVCMRPYPVVIPMALPMRGTMTSWKHRKWHWHMTIQLQVYAFRNRTQLVNSLNSDGSLSHGSINGTHNIEIPGCRCQRRNSCRRCRQRRGRAAM